MGFGPILKILGHKINATSSHGERFIKSLKGKFENKKNATMSSRARNVFLTFYKRNKKTLLVHCSVISTREFLRTLAKCERHWAASRASLWTSLVFLKLPACLYHSTMHHFFNKLTIEN